MPKTVFLAGATGFTGAFLYRPMDIVVGHVVVFCRLHGEPEPGVARRIAAAGMPMWIRTPVVPGYTADAANIAALGEFIAANLPTVQRWDLLAYTNLGQPKYHRLDVPYALDGAPLMTRAEMESLHAVAVRRVPVAVWSGATREP